MNSWQHNGRSQHLSPIADTELCGTAHADAMYSIG
jgi:hypothetical protein